MITLTRDQLIQAFGTNVRVIQMQLGDLTNDEGLRQMPFRGNCANWVLGHVINTRDLLLQMLGQAPIFGTAEQAIYTTDSPAITSAVPGVLPLHNLLTLLTEQQERITTGLQQATPTLLAQEIAQDDQPITIGAQIFGLYFHDTYHTGQFEHLRQLAGKNDKVI